MKQLIFGETITEEEYDALIWLGSKEYAGEHLVIVYINVFRFRRARTEWCDHCRCRFHLLWDLPNMVHVAAAEYPQQERADSIEEFFAQHKYKPRRLIFNTMAMEALIRDHQVDEQRFAEAAVKVPPYRGT